MHTDTATLLQTCLLATLAVGTAACSSPPAPAEPTPLPTPVERPAQAAEEDPLRHPSEVHLRGIKQLTNGGENAEAYWSFDGSELIFQTMRPPYQCDQIMRVPADGSREPVLVSTGKGRTTCSYFMPDGQSIIYSSTHEASAECPPPPDRSKGYVWALYDTYEIYKANADGSGLVNLSNRKGYDAEATVCGKDGSIIFTSDRDGDLELYRMDADGKNVVRLTNTPGYDGGAFFSADCTQIVWRASRPQGAELEDFKSLLSQQLVRPTKLELYVADADGKNVRQVTYLNAASFAPYLHPSGKRILFSTNYGDPKGREFDIWAINTDGSDLERITFSPGFDGFPMFSPDGKKLVFGSNRNQAKEGETNIFVADWIDAPAANDAGAAAQSKTAADRFIADVRWLADDARQGRGVRTAGIEQAADWLAAQLSTIGAVGAADGQGGYKQPLDMAIELVREAKTSLSINGTPVAAEAFVPTSFSAPTSVTGKTVVAGYGIAAKELGINDYRGINPKGKIVVVRRFTPSKGKFAKDDEAKRRYGDIEYKAFAARERGAIGLIVIDAPAPGEPAAEDAVLPTLSVRGRGDVGIPVMVLSRAAGEKLLQGSHTVAMAVDLQRKTKTVHNIVAKIPAGAQNRLPGAVIVGAHYDHLGLGEDGSLEGGEAVIHNGADDNASGTAALLEIARTLAPKLDTLRRDVYLIAFTAEESGLIGSTHFVEHLPDGLTPKDVVAMINLDMVGRMRDNTVSIMGTQTATEWDGIVKPACEEARVTCRTGGDGYGPSDHMAFYTAGIPVLFLFTGSHLDYHRASDDADHINAAGGAKIAQIAASLVQSAANRDGLLTYQRTTMPPPVGDVRVTGASLGTVPAYGDTSTEPGILLSDVRPGGPAEQAGVRGGDRVLKIGDTELRSVRDLMFVLRQAKPGEKVKLTVWRGGKRLSFDAVYGAPASRRGPR